MKPKGIKLIELIADKIFLAIFAVVFLVIVAMQFVGGGASVSVGGQADVPIDRAYEEVVTLAERKQAAMASDDVAPETPTNPPDVVARLTEAIGATDAGETLTQLVRLKPIPGVTGIDDSPQLSGRYALPRPPTPTRPLASAFGGALDPYELEAAPALAASLLDGGVQQPYDIFAISVEASFDAAAYRTILETDPDGSGPLSALPRNWWNARLEVLDVQLFRREVLADGGFGEEELIPPPPGFASVRDSLTGVLTVGELNQLVRMAEQPERARQIRQPFFYRIIAGEPWTPPSRQGDPGNLDWANPPARLRDVQETSIWAHDVTASPGATYQYRMRLVFPNPLMGYEKSIDEDLRHLAEASTIVSPPSAWSDAVQTPRPAYNFVRRAAIPAQGAVGIARPFAIVELYRFYYGYWRRGEMRVQAGDLIASQIELPSTLPIWDIEGQQAQRGGDAPNAIAADTGAFLLNIVVEPSPAPPGPGGRSQTRNAAIVGTMAGDVSVRRPDVDAASPLLSSLLRSAEAAAEAAVATPRPGARANTPAAPAGIPAPGRPATPAPREGVRDRIEG